MKEEYDFSKMKGKKNPYTGVNKMKKKHVATLIVLYLFIPINCIGFICRMIHLAYIVGRDAANTFVDKM